MKKNIIYFLLYIVVITETFVVIVERDDALEKLFSSSQMMLMEMAEVYAKGVNLDIPNKVSSCDFKGTDEESIDHTVIISPEGLYSPLEKESSKLKIELLKDQSKPENWSDGLDSITSLDTNNIFKIIKKNGNYNFVSKFTTNDDTKTFKFNVTHSFKPSLPDYLLEDQVDSLNSWFKTTMKVQDINRINFVDSQKFVEKSDTIEIKVSKGETHVVVIAGGD